MIDSKKFWMVWNGTSREVSRKHDSEAAATAEAVRLSNTCPHDVFYVMEALARVRPAKPPVEVVALAAPTLAEQEAAAAEEAARPF